MHILSLPESGLVHMDRRTQAIPRHRMFYREISAWIARNSSPGQTVMRTNTALDGRWNGETIQSSTRHFQPTDRAPPPPPQILQLPCTSMFNIQHISAHPSQRRKSRITYRTHKASSFSSATRDSKGLHTHRQLRSGFLSLDSCAPVRTNAHQCTLARTRVR